MVDDTRPDYPQPRGDPRPAVRYFPPAGGPRLTSTHRGGVTRYLLDHTSLVTFHRGDPPAHYDRVIRLVLEVLHSTNHRTPDSLHPYVEANLIWMAIARSRASQSPAPRKDIP